MPLKPGRNFTQLAADLGLSPRESTVLTVLAQHPTRDHPRVVELMDSLDRRAREVADVLVGACDLATTPDPNAQKLANFLKEWSAATKGSEAT